MYSPTTSVLGAILLSSVLVFVAPSASDAGARPDGHVVVAQADDENGTPTEPQSSVAAMTVRVDRLESTIRSLTGQVEELQYQNKKLLDDMRKMQQDVDFRFQDLNRGTGAGGVPPRPAKRTDADAPASASGMTQDASVVDLQPTPSGLPALRTARRGGDAFDPATNPNAPGAPRPLGTTPPSQPLPGTGDPGIKRIQALPSAPLDLMRRTVPPDASDQVASASPAPVLPSDQVLPRPVVAPSVNDVASLTPGGTREEYNGYVDLFKQGQFDNAATGLRGFLEKYPRDKLVPDAVYLLGETYTRLGRHREAAEQYLRLTNDFGKAPRAPDALLRLGMSLNAMGVKDQACAIYEEVTRRYPTASAEVRAGVDRESKRTHC